MKAGFPDLMELAALERADFADLLDELAPEQWATPSLCKGWTVQDVVAHVISYETAGYVGLARGLVRSRFSPSRMNHRQLERYQGRTSDELVAALRENLRPRGVTAGFGGGIGLTDCLIHQQDIRRPLGLPRIIPPDRLRAALDFSLRAPVLPSKRNADGLRVAATDIDWTYGFGVEVRGPGEVLLLTLAGRSAPISALEGPGAATLASRASGRRTGRGTWLRVAGGGST